MQKRYCDICGKEIVDKYMIVNTERKKQNPFDKFEIGEGHEIYCKETCLDCYEKLYDVFKEFEKNGGKV